MIHLTTRLLLTPLLLLSVLFAAEEPILFDAYEKPQRPYAHVQYAPIALGEMQHTILMDPAGEISATISQRRIHRIEASFLDRQLVGRVRLTLKSTALLEDSRIQIVLQDRQSEHRVVDAALSQTEFAFDGTFAGSMQVSIAGIESDENPVAQLSIESIVLSNKRRIMLLGDSITEVHYDTTGTVTWGYRHRLYHRLANVYSDIDFVGTSGDDPYEAHCDGGKRIGAFLQNGGMDVRGPMNTHRPHIVAIHLGTNDVNNYARPAETAEDMRRLINYLLQWRYDENGAALPDDIRLQQIIVSLIIPMKYRDELSIETNRQIALVVDDFVSGRATGRPEPIHITDHFSRFREADFLSLMFDRLHPNHAGHELMSVTYFRTFDAILSDQPNRSWFTDVSFQANIIGTDYSYPQDGTTEFLNQGIAIADVTGDGWDDIYITRSDYGNKSAHDELYVRDHSFPYINRTADFDVMDSGGSRGSVFVDIDNDGDFDLFNGNSPGQNILYENQGDNGFTRRTDAGIENINATTMGVAAFDADNDGDMDLLAVNSKGVNEFYLNNGSGRFTPAESELRDVRGASFSNYMAAPADFDNDGDTDVFMTYRDAANKLFVNDGVGAFRDATSEAGLSYTGRSNGASWADLDLDGDLDLVVTESRPVNNSAKLLRLYENNGDGTFSDITSEINIPVDAFSTLIADFNNDGFDDLITTFEKSKGEFWENHGNWSFEKIPDTGAEINGGDIRGAAVLDLDDDGDVDILMARADMLNVMLQNNFLQENYLKVRVNGPGGNKGGFGTKLWLYEAGHLNDPHYLLGHREAVSASGHTSQPSPTLHFGLAAHPSIDLMARFTDGSFLAERAISANQTITIEPANRVAAGIPALIDYYAGDGQQATVGELLLQPLEVQVTDANNSPVSGVRVPFTVTRGSAQLLLPGTSEKISLEAENGQFQSPLHRAHADDVAGNAFVFFDAFRNGGSSSIKWQREMDAAAAYSLWVRICNSGDAVQTVSMTIDGALRSIRMTPDPTWQWLRAGDDNRFTFQPGTHKIELSLNNPGLQIDKLLLVRDEDYTPAGLEELLEMPDGTDSQGIARRFVQLGTRAEEIQIEASLEVDGILLPKSPVIFNVKAVAGPAARLDKTSGDGQTGAPGNELPQPLVVTVYDAMDNPVPQISVTFSALNRLFTVNTDENGRAAFRYTPDSSSSRQKIEVRVDGITPVTFTIFVSGVAVKMELLSPAPESGTVMQPIHAPIRVRVLTDSLTGEPAIQQPVEFTTWGRGSRLAIAPAFNNDSVLVVETDASGIAQAYWQLGDKSGTQILKVDAGNISGSPRLVTAVASPALPALLLLTEGNEQSGVIGSRLDKPFRVRITDLYRNPVPDVQVRFTSTFDGTFDGSPMVTKMTNSSGEAFCFYTLGPTSGYAHVARVEAYVESRIGAPIDFYATALPGNAMISSIHAGDNQVGIVGTRASQPLQIIVRDQFGNPVPGFRVTFTTTDGRFADGQQSISVLTEQDGIASAIYHFGEIAGEQRVRGECPGLTPFRHEFLLHATPGKPTKISRISGDHQIGSRNSRLAEPLVVRITDRYGNGVIEFPVTFVVVSEGGSIDGKREVVTSTDSSGRASAYVTVGQELGEANIIVHAVGRHNGSSLQGSPIIFYASTQLGQPHAMHVLSDTTDLIGAANHELPQPIVVKIVDQDDQAIADFTVQCHISSGSGYFQENGERSIDLETDADGRASIRWVLGGLGEQQRLIVIALVDGRHLSNSPVTIAASTVRSTAKELVIASGDGQSGARGEILQHPFIVRILDTYNEPVAGHSVFFRVAKGDGAFTASGTPNYSARTDEDGSAVAFFRLGQAVGHKAYEILVRSFSESGVELFNSPDTIYVHGTARELVIISGDGQSQTVNRMLAPLRTRLVDENNQGIAGEQVIFEPMQGEIDFIDPLQQTTDAEGYAQIVAKLGARSGRSMIKAMAPAYSSTVTFLIRALPDRPFALRKMSGDEQTGIAHHPLNQKIVVQLVDQYENGIPGNRLLFAAQPGHGVIMPASIMETDSMGLVSAAWQLGSVTPQQYLSVTAEGLSLAFRAHVQPNQAPAISAPDSLFTVENDKVRLSLSATDVENDSISIAMLSGPTGAVFNRATTIFSWTPSYEQAGLHEVVFQARDAFGASSAKSLQITVANANRPPTISVDQCQPPLRRLGKIKMPATVEFHVHATDADGDVLHYLWKVNGLVKGASRNYRLSTQTTGSGAVTVQAFVHDQEDTVGTSWTLEVITAVELKSFVATHEPYAGIQLTWESRYEWDNAGFYALRSLQEEGPFETVSYFIPSRADGKYHFMDRNVESGTTYFYQVQDVASNGARHESDIIHIAPPLPERFALLQNYPNPFNPSTILRFDIPDPSFVTLRIFDLLGRQTRALIAAELKPGFHKVEWDGVNDHGEAVASGLYHAVLDTPAGRFVQKMMLVR